MASNKAFVKLFWQPEVNPHTKMEVKKKNCYLKWFPVLQWFTLASACLREIGRERGETERQREKNKMQKHRVC